jgi:glucose-1-phosphate cytidylyltransferase
MQFAEKKDNEDSRINGWFMVLNKKIIEYVSWDDMPLEKDPLENLAKEGQLMAYKHSWFRFAMDTLQNKNHLESLWNVWKAPWKTR